MSNVFADISCCTEGCTNKITKKIAQVTGTKCLPCALQTKSTQISLDERDEMRFKMRSQINN